MNCGLCEADGEQACWELAEPCVQSAVISDMKPSWKLIFTGAPYKFRILTLLETFTDDLGDRAELFVHQEAVLLFRRTLTWRKGLTGTSWSSVKGNMKSCTWRNKNHRHQANWLEIILAERALGVLGGHEVEHEPAVHPRGLKNSELPGLHQAWCC